MRTIMRMSTSRIGGMLDEAETAINERIEQLLLALHPDARQVELHWEPGEPAEPGDMAYTAVIDTVRDAQGHVVVEPDDSYLTEDQKDVLDVLGTAYGHREQVSAAARYFSPKRQ